MTQNLYFEVIPILIPDIFKVIDRKSILAVLATSFIITVLEVASVSAVIPAIGVILGGKLPEFIGVFFHGIGFQSSATQKIVLLTIIAVVFIFRGAFLCAIMFVQSRIVFNTQRNLSNFLFEKYLFAKFERVTDVASFTLVRSTTTELSNIANGILLSFSVLVSEIAMIAGVLLVLFYIQPIAAVCLLLGTFTLVGPIIRLNHKCLITHGKTRLDMEENRVQLAQEVVAGIREIKVYGLESQLRKTIDAANRIYSHVLTRIHFLQCFPRIYFETIGIFTLLLICAVQVYNGRSANDILMFLTVSGLAAFRALPSVAKSLSQVQQMRFYHPSLTAVLELMDKLQKESIGGNNSIKDNTLKSATPSQSLCIKLKNAAYNYESHGVTVFRSLNLELFSGEVVGLVGPSGIGKSTLLDCIIGLRKLSQGTVSVTDTDTREAALLRVSYVPQTPVMLGGTIWRNVSLANDDAPPPLSPNPKLTRAFEVSGLADLMLSRNLTLTSMVVEGGRNFSGGQRQRLALARALYRDADVLVLDEATSALDKEAEQAIFKKIQEHYSARLIIMVTHRAELLSLCSKILRMEPYGNIKVVLPKSNVAEPKCTSV